VFVVFYQNIKDYPTDKFRRLTGVLPATFDLMCDSLRTNASGRGRPPFLSLEDRLLMTLMYLREYRTFEHIGETYGVSEATVCRTIRQVESVLIQDKRFHLPGKKALLQSDTVFEVILIDATESPCERPKKNSISTIAARRNDTLKKPR
jgi:hypothetical protein